MNIRLHSGEMSDFKIECNALTDEDIECIAYLISKKYSFGKVDGVPKGGLRLATALKKYQDDNHFRGLIVDDVLTTGKSMEQFKSAIYANPHSIHIQGIVIFARNECPLWIDPIFKIEF